MSGRGGAAAAATHVRSARLFSRAAFFAWPYSRRRATWFAIFLRHKISRLFAPIFFPIFVAQSRLPIRKIDLSAIDKRGFYLRRKIERIAVGHDQRRGFAFLQRTKPVRDSEDSGGVKRYGL